MNEATLSIKIFSRILKISAVLICLIFSYDTVQVNSQAGFLPGPIQKGICYVTWDKTRFSSEYSDESLKKLSTIGVEYISVCVTHYQEEYNSTKITKTDRTPSLKSTQHVINKSHDLGLKVMLKPHIDLLHNKNGSFWRADIGFSKEADWEKWFENYQKLILKYAKMAEKTKVELFCIGTELSFTTQKNSYWLNLIEKIRKIYSGKILYAANWDNFQNIQFWEQLDYIGIDAYFPLTYKPDPTVEDLLTGWKKWKAKLNQLRKNVDKPIIFTEIGYASTSHAPQTPWKGGIYGNANPEIQAKCYEAFFKAVWNEPWMAGAYWWKWDTNVHAGGLHNRQFTPQNKPAEKIIAKHYKQM